MALSVGTRLGPYEIVKEIRGTKPRLSPLRWCKRARRRSIETLRSTRSVR